MSEIAIQAQNISKLYQLGTFGSGSLRQDLHRWWQTNILKQKNPYFMDVKSSDSLENNSYIWALKNVDLEVKQGEVWGIVGSNGSGKSTLLKILSRITRPTSGVIRGNGKLSSLLEIGTGFHADLTGRENIFTSGYMLGMTKQEITKKFDEIVEFSGVERFLDTPVKRYSSGMYVRLAFAVSAHLEPDILIVDEVLAVGDAEFQKKCLGKLKNDSIKKGRTIIFVSHNSHSVVNLCTHAMWIEKGIVKDTGKSKDVVNNYLGTLQQITWKREFPNLRDAPGNEMVKVVYVEMVPHLFEGQTAIDIRNAITVKFRVYNHDEQALLTFDLLLSTISEDCIFSLASPATFYKEGFIEGECTIPGHFLNDGSYYFSLYIIKDNNPPIFMYEACLLFDVDDYRENTNRHDKWWGYVRPNFPLQVKATLPALVV